MRSVFYKELRLYFGSPIAYLVTGVFLLSTTLLLWVFPGYYNVLDTEFAHLDGLFINAPWLFLWLIPALCMHLFSDVYKSKKSVLLFTRPLSSWAIILGKFCAAFTVVAVAIAPTFISLYSIGVLANPAGNIDVGAHAGSYLGLLLLAVSYLSLSLFSSAITDNQLVAFVIGVLFCAFFYVGWEYFASIVKTNSIGNFLISLGINEHYRSLSRGVVDSADLGYFLCLSVLFLLLTHFIISKKR